MTESNSILLTATLLGATAKHNPNTGNVTYRVQFSYPQAFDEYLKQLLAGVMDIYWNGELIAQSALINHLTQKPQKDTDPLYVAYFDLDGGDATRYNMAGATNDPIGELRLVATQMTLFSQP